MADRTGGARSAAARRKAEAALRPGHRILVTFAGDAGWHHERLLICPVAPGRWIILTGDGDMYEEAFSDYSDWRQMDDSAGPYPPDVVDVVAFP